MNQYRDKGKTSITSLYPNVQRYSHIFGRLSPLSIMLETSGMQVFFLVDILYCKTETDDLKDAIKFYYPPQIPELQACSLCGQLLGIIQFSSTIFSLPKIVTLSRGKFAVKKWGKYLFMLGGSTDSPSLKLLQGLDSLCRVFCFYHKNLDLTLEVMAVTKGDIHLQMRNLWTFFLKSVRHDHSRLGSIPGVLYKASNLSPMLVSKALYLIKSCQKLTSIIAGCVIYKRQLVVTQLPTSLTFFLCYYRASEHVEENFTGQPIPDGLVHTKVYLQNCELKKLLELNPAWKYLDRKKDSLAVFTNDYEGAESSSVISDSNNDKASGIKYSFNSDQERLFSSNEDKVDKKENVLHSSQKEPANLEQTILKKKCNSLIICDIAQESFKKINQLEEEKRQRRRKGRKKKSVLKNGPNDESTTCSTSSDMKPLENLVTSENILPPSFKTHIVSSDSSFFEPPSWTPENEILTLNLNLKPMDNTAASSQTEFGSSLELGIVSPTYVGKTCPLFLGDPALSEGNLNHYLDQEKVTEVTMKVKEKPEEDVDLDSFVYKSNCQYDDNVQELNLIAVTQLDTTLFLLADEVSMELKETLKEICLLALSNLNLEISERAKYQMKPQSSSGSLYLDNIWNVVSGNKYSKAYHLVEDFSECAGVKSLTSMTINGVAYAHSSMTHDVYIQNETRQGAAGIPSCQDPIAKISGLTKQDQDKMGYYLLK